MLGFWNVRRAAWALALILLSGCKAAGCIANAFGDVAGDTGDVACDRRIVSEGEAEPFCQEVIDTVAGANIKDDCFAKHHAHYDDGRCPREKVVGGCKYLKVNDDGSEVYDWFYDVSAEVDAGKKFVFDAVPLTKDDVKKRCADPKRYESGAIFLEPPNLAPPPDAR
jgi:hypothetical protein